MSLIDALRHRLYVLRRGERYADEVRRELRFHRELDALARDGNSLGNETYYREEVRTMTLQLWIDRLRQDLGYAVRGLRRSPGFTAAVVIILGLGVGVNAAMFSILDRIFVRYPTGVAQPQQLRRLYADFKNGLGASAPRIATSHMPFPWIAAADAALDSSAGLFAYTMPESVVVRDGKRLVTAHQSLVTRRYFATLGITPQRGRLFSAPEMDIATPAQIAVVSDAFWKNQLGRDPAAIGRTLRIEGVPYTVIGVLPRGFTGIDLDPVDIWLPANTYALSDGGFARDPWYRSFHSSFNAVARIHDPLAEHRAELTAANAIRATHLTAYIDDPTLRVVSASVILARGPAAKEASLVVATRVAGVSVILLVIVIANLVNLVLLRTTRRRRELAVRRALGVSSGRLVHQLAVETTILALFGAVVAVVVGAWSQLLLRRLFFPDAQWTLDPIDERMLGLVFLASTAIGIAAGIASAFATVQTDVAGALKAGSNNGAYRTSGTRNALLGIQAGLCVVLLVGAGLFLRSLETVRSIGTGYESDNRFFAIPMFEQTSPSRTSVPARLPDIADRLRRSRDLAAVGYGSMTPLRGMSFQDVFVQTRDSTFKLAGANFATTASVSPQFLSAAGLRLVAGRDFYAGDDVAAPRVAIVNREMARRFWPGESALGQCLFVGERSGPCSTIVGVVTDARRMQLIEATGPQFYTPITQPSPFHAGVLAIQARPGRLDAAVRETSAALAASFPDMLGVRTWTMDRIIEPQLRPWRLGATLFTALGALALLVAAVGIYAVVAYATSQRTHEMGVRIALGASARDIVDLVLRDGLASVALGAAAGALLAILLGHTIASLLFGVEPGDAGVMIAALTTVTIVGAGACLVPGLRASAVDPTTALRSD